MIKNVNQYGLKKVDEMIEIRRNWIHQYVEEMYQLNQRKSEILKNIEKNDSHGAKKWDINQVKRLLDSGLKQKEVAKILGVKYPTLVSYIYRMREQGKDI